MVNDKRKKNQGRPPAGPNKKIPITIYESREDIKELGGMDAVRKMLKEKINNDLYRIRKTCLT